MPSFSALMTCSMLVLSAKSPIKEATITVDVLLDRNRVSAG